MNLDTKLHHKFVTRLSSIQLLGDLLYHISGVTGKMSATGDDDENFGTAEGFKVIVIKQILIYSSYFVVLLG